MNAHQRRKALRARAKGFKLYPHQLKVLDSIKKMGARLETFVPASQSLSRLVRHFQENPPPPMILMPKPEAIHMRPSDIGAADMIIAISASQEPLPAAPIIMHTLKPRRLDIKGDFHFGDIGINIIDEAHLPKGAGKALLMGDFVDGSAVQIVDLPVRKDET
jgi:hypothetical protein